MLAATDLIGVSAFITALVGLLAWAVTQFSRLRAERSAKALLTAQNIVGKSAVEGFVVLAESQQSALELMQGQIDGLREEVDKCEAQKAEIASQFREVIAMLRVQFPNLPPMPSHLL